MGARIWRMVIKWLIIRISGARVSHIFPAPFIPDLGSFRGSYLGVCSICRIGIQGGENNVREREREIAVMALFCRN